MSNSTTGDIKAIIEAEKLKAAGKSPAIPEEAAAITENNETVSDIKPVKPVVKKSQQLKKEVQEPEILKRIRAFEKESESFLLHVKVNKRVYDLANQLNASTKITVTKLLGFSVIELFKNNPELEEAIKKHFKSLDL